MSFNGYENLNPELREAIESSKYILDLEDDFDGEGSPKYSKETWERAVEFVLHYERELREKGKNIEIPRICPGFNGAIDLYWKAENKEILAKIPVSPDKEIAYYGDDFGENKIKGTTKLSEYDSNLLAWLEKV